MKGSVLACWPSRRPSRPGSFWPAGHRRGARVAERSPARSSSPGPPLPAPKVVKVNKDNEVCGQEKKIAEVQVGPNGGVGAPSSRWPVPRAPRRRSRLSWTRRAASFGPTSS